MTKKKSPATAGGAGEQTDQQDHIQSSAYVQDQLERLVARLFDLGDLVEIRRLRSGKSTSHRAVDLPQLASQLIAESSSGQQLFFGANPRIELGNGRTTAANCSEEVRCGKCAKCVSHARCLFGDLDKITLAEALFRLKESDLPAPTLIIRSGGGVHMYWRLDEPLMDLARWSRLQKGLAARLGGDPSVHDPPRIMRLPGFPNSKYDPPRRCEIVDAP